MTRPSRHRLAAAFACLRNRVIGVPTGDAAAQSPVPNTPDALPRSKFDYRTLVLSPAQIEAQAFKAQLGGGAAGWERRGAFQLALLRHLGLQPQQSLLDIGCGPLRAGVHFLGFLAPGGYRGVDFNASLVEAGRREMDRLGFAAQSARVSVLQDFNFASLGETYDYLLCFSVLNHCSAFERAHFFAEVPRIMRARSRLVVTHAGWFDAGDFPSSGVVQAEVFDAAQPLPADLAPVRWGFDDPRSTPLPIRVFRRG